MTNFLKDFFVLSEPLSIVFMFILLVLFFLMYLLKHISFSKRMFLSLCIGVLLGFIIQLLANFPAGNVSSFDGDLLWVKQIYVWYGFVVKAFVSLLKLMVLPIVFVGISSSLLQIDKNIKIGSVFFRAIFWLFLTTVIASFIGVMLGKMFNLGLDASFAQSSKDIKQLRSLSVILLELMPNNIIKAMANDNLVGVILIACLFVFGARKVGANDEFKQSYKSFSNMFLFLNKVVLRVVANIIKLMPYAVIAMMANTIVGNGINAIKEAGLFIFLIYLSGVFMFLVHGLILTFYGLNPLVYFKKAFSTLLLAFTSRSSAGVLPYTIQTLQNMGVSSSNSNFVASIGATVGMNGCAGYYVGLVAVFMLNYFKVDIDFSYIILIFIITLIGSLSIAGVPGISIVAASIMVTGLGYGDKFYLLGAILAIDPIIDMIRTSSNVSGAMVASICTDKGVGSFDKDKFMN